MSRTTHNSSGLRSKLTPHMLFDVGNISVVGSSGDTGSMTPQLANRSGISHVRNLLEQKFNNESMEVPVRVEDKSSPGLARLRMTPGGQLKQKQRLLMKKHEDARKQSDKINVGGGVTLWPEMEDMRLHKWETLKLIAVCLALFAITVLIFLKLHGSLLKKLWEYDSVLVEFGRNHVLDLTREEKFHSTLINWHTDFRKLLAEIHAKFDMSHLTVAYQLYILTYLSGVAVLLYFLLDNMFSTNKLSPRRIKTWYLSQVHKILIGDQCVAAYTDKQWVSLLTVIGTWTGLMCILLIAAQHLEHMVEMNVLKLSETLGDMVETDLDTNTFHTVLLYWRTRSLPPTTHGVLTILGMLPVRDVMSYLQYYSLPIIMALVTPVVKLVMALLNVYNVNIATN